MSDQPFEMSPEFAELVAEANAEFEAMVAQRLEKGAEQYGPYSFFQNNTLEMALEELADLVNYARFTFTKVWVLGRSLNAFTERELPKTDTTVSTGEMEEPEMVHGPGMGSEQ
jgi:hypothetical protein